MYVQIVQLHETLKKRQMTVDFASQIKDCKALSTSEFAIALITNIKKGS